MDTIEDRLATGELLVDHLEKAMETGVPATVDRRTLMVPIDMDHFEEYNQQLGKLKALKQLIEERGINFKDYLSFRLAFRSATRREPLNSLYKGLYYYHMITWYAMFPREKVGDQTLLHTLTRVFC